MHTCTQTHTCAACAEASASARSLAALSPSRPASKVPCRTARPRHTFCKNRAAAARCCWCASERKACVMNVCMHARVNAISMLSAGAGQLLLFAAGVPLRAGPVWQRVLYFSSASRFIFLFGRAALQSCAFSLLAPLTAISACFCPHSDQPHLSFTSGPQPLPSCLDACSSPESAKPGVELVKFVVCKGLWIFQTFPSCLDACSSSGARKQGGPCFINIQISVLP